MMTHSYLRLSAILFVSTFALAGCSEQEAKKCQVIKQDGATALIQCDGEEDLVVTAPSGEPGENGVNGQGSLFTSTAATQEECVFGGRQVKQGLDLNGNDELEESEVKDTFIVCSGVSGDGNILEVELQAVSAMECESGGVQVVVGVDQNQDSKLEDLSATGGPNEVSSNFKLCNGNSARDGESLTVKATPIAQGDMNKCGGLGGHTLAYLREGGVEDTSVDFCNGSQAADGTDGSDASVVIMPEPKGTNCAFGGIRLDTGVETSILCNRGRITQLAVGESHACALLEGTDVWCWGYNFYTQVGDRANSQADVLTPVPVQGLKGEVSKVTAGLDHTCALMRDGSAQCWGWNNGLLGTDAQSGTPRILPEDVKNIGVVNQISAGAQHSCVLLADDTIECWGSRNTFGQLGKGDDVVSKLPVPITPGLIEGVVDLSAGKSHTCVALRSGEAWCWGKNDQGQLGTGSVSTPPNAFISSPTKVSFLDDVASVSTGRNHSCALLFDGTVSCWGQNDKGQLGNDSTTDSAFPVQVSRLTNVIDVQTKTDHTCALTANQQVWCWGNNAGNQIDSRPGDIRRIPEQIVEVEERATFVGVGDRHTCVLFDSGTVQCWGQNDKGQLGIGTAILESIVPVNLQLF